MTGILLITVLLLWAFLCAWIVGRVGNLMPERRWRSVLKFVLFSTLLPLPLIDEILAKPQFEALCREKAVLVLESSARGEKVVWFDSSVRTTVPIGTLEAALHTKSYVEASTSAPVYRYTTVTVAGGRLMRALAISETNSPLIFSSSCAPPQIGDMTTWRQANGIKEIPRPISK